jgi:hypothetical protein
MRRLYERSDFIDEVADPLRRLHSIHDALQRDTIDLV